MSKVGVLRNGPYVLSWLLCSGVGAGLAFLWDVHGEIPERNHPTDRQAFKPCAENLHFHKDPLWTQGEFVSSLDPFVLHYSFEKQIAKLDLNQIQSC